MTSEISERENSDEPDTLETESLKYADIFIPGRESEEAIRRFVGATPYDNETPSQYPEVPEFFQKTATGVLSVAEGDSQVGSAYQSYASENFSDCSGLILRGGNLATFGLFHASADTDWYPVDFGKLEPLAGGQVIAIEGSSSSSKNWLLRELRQKLGIQYVATLAINTRRPGQGNRHFHVAFRPVTDEILVARNSHRDLLTFRGFNLGKTPS